MFSLCQYGFSIDRGTQPLLENFFDCLFSCLETSKYPCAIFVDVYKAFDSICHIHFNVKLYRSGLHGPFMVLLNINSQSVHSLYL